jgi:hypothetical protein
MGDTDCFYIYDIFQNSKHLFVDKRTNVSKSMGHAKVEKMKAVIEIIKDSDVLVARQKSPNFIKIAENTKYQPVVVRTEKIPDILMTLCKSFDEIYEYIARRKNGETFGTIIEL